MKHVIIGTAGHVDHGKTMLIKALTGIDTDRLIEEKKRGITIELGFAHIEFDDHTQAGIIDVPGHEKFIKNMLAGAGGIDLAMLVVAADEGFMPQTVEHLDILTLLGIRDGVVVITKTDMVDEEWVEIVREDIAAHVKGTFLEGKPVLPVSAYTGQGIPELKKELQQRVSRVAVRNEQIPFRLPVDRVFSKDGFGTVVTGIKDLARSYKEAQVAFEVGKVFDTEKNIISYENLGIGRLIYQLPTTLCEMFLQEVFKNGSLDSLDRETLMTIQAFFENNLNVSETSRKLFVHRNTLVYRLEKIRKLTGLDLREFDHAITFKVALMVKRYLTTKPVKY